ncbi:MAG: YIP1 family protein, partial [Candidatus Eremiobacteraeota bacterium]|nr:YIP1 family protein [Candidatus Eremiobacteraeota bacterium]
MSMSDTTAATPPAEKANGLATYLMVLYAPGQAFATLARVPTWGWAAVVGIILTLAGTLIVMPATIHYTHIAQEQQLAQMSADKQEAARQAMAMIPDWIYPVFGIIGSFFAPWLYWLIGSVVYLIGAALGGGDARFRAAWVGAVNVYIIPALGNIVAGVIIMLRGAANINAQSDLFVLPSLAMLVHGSPKLEFFLYTFNIVNIWLYVVAVIMLQQLLKLRGIAAVVTVAVL